MDRSKHRKKPRVITRSLSSTSVNWTEYTPLVQVKFYCATGNSLTSHHLQSGASGDTPILTDPVNPSFYHILKFIKPDWYIIFIGVLLYGVMGAGYPIFGALMAHVSSVSPLCKVSLLYVFNIPIFVLGVE